MLGWKKHKLESRLPGEISITSDESTGVTRDIVTCPGGIASR